MLLTPSFPISNFFICEERHNTQGNAKWFEMGKHAQIKVRDPNRLFLFSSFLDARDDSSASVSGSSDVTKQPCIDK